MALWLSGQRHKRCNSYVRGTATEHIKVTRRARRYDKTMQQEKKQEKNTPDDALAQNGEKHPLGAWLGPIEKRQKHLARCDNINALDSGLELLHSMSQLAGEPRLGDLAHIGPRQHTARGVNVNKIRAQSRVKHGNDCTSKATQTYKNG